MAYMTDFRGTPVIEVEDLEEMDKIIKSKAFKKQFGDLTPIAIPTPQEPIITLADKFFDILANPNLDIRPELFDKFGKQSASFNSENIIWEIFFDFSMLVVVKGYNLALVTQYIGSKGALNSLENHIRGLDSPPPKEEIDQFFTKVNELIEQCRVSK